MKTRLVLLFGAIAIACLSMTATATAAPGVPAAPVQIFNEDFEHVVNPADPEMINAYTGGALGMTYTADPTWISVGQCNGVVTAQNTTNFANPPYCTGAGVTALKTLASQLGAVPPDAANHALTAWTSTLAVATTPDPTLQTLGTIPLTSGINRFISFSVDAAVTSCGAAHPLLRFFVLDGATEIPVTTTAIDPCTDPRGVAVGGNRIGTYASDGSTLVSSPAIGFKLTNDTATSGGNDYAYDNVRVLDVTPQLDKSFSATSATVGDTVRLDFTITNSAELAQKAGWSFTDVLPAGMTLAANPNATTDCSSGTITPAGGGFTIAGNLDAGQASCKASVNVTFTKAGSLSNGAANLKVTGVNPPDAPATIKVDEPKLKVTQKVSKSKLKPGQKTTLTGKATNTSGATLRNVKVCQTVPAGLKFAGGSPKLKKSGNKYCHTFASVAPGETVKIKVKARAAAGDCGPINPKVSGDGSGIDGDSDRARLRVPCALAAGGVTG